MPLTVLAGPEIGLPTLSDDCPLSRYWVREVCLQGLTPRSLAFGCCEKAETCHAQHGQRTDLDSDGMEVVGNVEQRGSDVCRIRRGGRQRDVFQIGLSPGYARTYNSSDHSCLNNLRENTSPKASMSSLLELIIPTVSIPT